VLLGGMTGAAGRERRYWVGESETAGWYDRCATGRERRCWAALLGGKEVTTVDCWMGTA
jgi:hypothetical protein